MARSGLAQVARVARLGLRTPPVARISSPGLAAASSFLQLSPRLLPSIPIPTMRFISISPDRKGITPDDKPPAPKDVDIPPVVRTAADITDDVYHSVADEYMDRLVTHLEGIQDQREDIDVEYSVRSSRPCPFFAVLFIIPWLTNTV